MCSGVDSELPLLPKYPVRLGEECKRWPGEKVVGKANSPFPTILLEVAGVELGYPHDVHIQILEHEDGPFSEIKI